MGQLYGEPSYRKLVAARYGRIEVRILVCQIMLDGQLMWIVRVIHGRARMRLGRHIVVIAMQHLTQIGFEADLHVTW